MARRVQLIALLVAAIAAATPARAESLIAGATPAPERELAEARGGFAPPWGGFMDISFASRLSVDGKPIDLAALEGAAVQQWSDGRGIDIEMLRGLAGAVISLRNTRDGVTIQQVNDIRIDISGAAALRSQIARSALHSLTSMIGNF